jgi:hypothetical protein
MDQEMRDMLASSLRRVLTETSDRALDERLADLGWDEVLADDAPTALRTLFETKGEVLGEGDALGPVLVRTLAGAVPRPGLTGATLVLPSTLGLSQLPGQVEGDKLIVDGSVLAAPAPGASLVIPVGQAPSVRLAIVATDGLDYQPSGAEGDPPGLARVTGTLDAGTAAGVDWVDAGAAWEAAVAVGRWSAAAELVGIGRQVIAEAVAYTGQRVQYGRPIGTFQALQHRLASAYTSIVGASQVVAEAASSGSPWVALVAKALAGHAAEDCCTQAQQSYGAIGFTWEHPFHRYLRRTYLLDRLLGDWRTLEFEIGTTLQQTREAPRIGTL